MQVEPQNIFAEGKWKGTDEALDDCLVRFSTQCRDNKFGQHELQFQIAVCPVPIRGVARRWMIQLADYNRESLYTHTREITNPKFEGWVYGEVQAQKESEWQRVILKHNDAYQDAMQGYMRELLKSLKRSGLITETEPPTAPATIQGQDATPAAKQAAQTDIKRANKKIMPTNNPIELFFSYSHKDEKLRDELAKHLSIMRRQGVIQEWHDRKITSGKEWKGQIDTHLNNAQIILLLVSADFISSDYCYDVELKRAMERHDNHEARVIPIILRACKWKDAPFGKLLALPKDGKPVRDWTNRDKAFTNIVDGIEQVVKEMRTNS